MRKYIQNEKEIDLKNYLKVKGKILAIEKMSKIYVTGIL